MVNSAVQFAASGMEVASWCLVGVTGVLVIVTGIMAYSNWRSVREAGKAVAATARVAKAAESDLAQGQLLVQIGQDQVRAAQDQASSALQALIADTRPLIVPAVTATGGSMRFDVFEQHSGQITIPGDCQVVASSRWRGVGSDQDPKRRAWSGTARS